MVHEIDGTDGMREKVQHSNGDKLPVESVTLVKRTEFTLPAIDDFYMSLERRLAEKRAKPGLGDAVGWLVMDNTLIIFKECVFLFCIFVRLQSHNQLMSRVWGPV